MPTPTRLYPLSGLRGIQNARTRIYAAGSDPLFGPGGTRRDLRPAATRATSTPTDADAQLIWQKNWLDRLQTQLTRYRD